MTMPKSVVDEEAMSCVRNRFVEPSFTSDSEKQRAIILCWITLDIISCGQTYRDMITVYLQFVVILSNFS